MREIARNIRKAVEGYLRAPERTRRRGLRKNMHAGWLVLEQNPERESPYARLHRAGLGVAHILHEEEGEYVGFVIRGRIYIKPPLLARHFDAQILNEVLAPYFEKLEQKELAGVRVEYSPDEEGKALVTRLEGRDIHTGVRLDLVERTLL